MLLSKPQVYLYIEMKQACALIRNMLVYGKRQGKWSINFDCHPATVTVHTYRITYWLQCIWDSFVLPFFFVHVIITHHAIQYLICMFCFPSLRAKTTLSNVLWLKIGSLSYVQNCNAFLLSFFLFFFWLLPLGVATSDSPSDYQKVFLHKIHTIHSFRLRDSRITEIS